MNKIIRTLGSIHEDNNLNDRQKYIIGETLEHMQHLEQQSCQDCEHFQEQYLDGVTFKDCECNFDCTVVRPNKFKKRLINE
jgi:hypothetical protein